MTDYHLTRTAVFVVLERDGKLFFLRRANTRWANGLLTVPAGHVDKGEFVTEAAVREVMEEAGVEVRPEDLEFVHVDYIKDVYIDFYFKAKKWTGEPTLKEPNMASEAIWVDKNALPEDVLPQLKKMFAEVERRKFFSEEEDLPV